MANACFLLLTEPPLLERRPPPFHSRMTLRILAVLLVLREALLRLFPGIRPFFTEAFALGEQPLQFLYVALSGIDARPHRSLRDLGAFRLIFAALEYDDKLTVPNLAATHKGEW